MDWWKTYGHTVAEANKAAKKVCKRPSGASNDEGCSGLPPGTAAARWPEAEAKAQARARAEDAEWADGADGEGISDLGGHEVEEEVEEEAEEEEQEEDEEEEPEEEKTEENDDEEAFWRSIGLGQDTDEINEDSVQCPESAAR